MIGGIDQDGQRPIRKRAQLRPGLAVRRGIGLANASAVGLDDNDGIVFELEQKPVACFGLTQLHIVAFERLLCLDEALLQHRSRPHVETDGKDVAVFAGPDGEIPDRNVAVVRGVVDLPPSHRLGGAGGREHGFDLWPALDGNCVDPVLSDPGVAPTADQIARRERYVDNLPARVGDQRDVTGSTCDTRKRVDPERGEVCLGRPE